jgi:hypothetical protein
MKEEAFCGNCKFWYYSDEHKINFCHIEIGFTKVRATKADNYCPYHQFK